MKYIVFVVFTVEFMSKIITDLYSAPTSLEPGLYY